MRSLPSPARRFPFDAQAGTLPIPVPDCHLVRTAIPYLLVLRQPRCFPQRSDPVLILFCKQTFKEISPVRQGHGAGRVAPLSRPVHARQATLHTAFTAYSRVAPQCRFISGIVQKSLTTGEYASAQYPVSTAAGSRISRPLKTALKPQA